MPGRNILAYASLTLRLSVRIKKKMSFHPMNPLTYCQRQNNLVPSWFLALMMKPTEERVNRGIWQGQAEEWKSLHSYTPVGNNLLIAPPLLRLLALLEQPYSVGTSPTCGVSCLSWFMGFGT
ncbi:UNVERIFIED_CONTAM: hypothetical protein K2H54_019080 [Gekko kuhli]